MREAGGMSRQSVLSDAQWDVIDPLLPGQKPWSERPRWDHRQIVEASSTGTGAGSPGAICPPSSVPGRPSGSATAPGPATAPGTGSWTLCWSLVRADADGKLGWSVAVDSTICRAHQHGTNLPRATGGTAESHESGRRAG